MSIPVVISDNGLGLPVRKVTKNAPAAIISGNGLGVPVVLVESGGVPLNITGGPVIAVPVNIVPPLLAQEHPLINIPATTTNGEWDAQGDLTFSYQWQSSADGVIWADIPGERGSSYTPVFAGRDKLFRVGVIATNEAGPSEISYSNQTLRIGPHDFQIYPGIYGAPSGDTGFARGRMGDLIGGQPVPGFDLVALYSRGDDVYGNIAFDGDCLEVIGGLKLLLDPAPAEWGEQTEWRFVDDETQCTVSPAGAFDTTASCIVTWAEK